MVYCSLSVEKNEAEVPCENQCARALKNEKGDQAELSHTFLDALAPICAAISKHVSRLVCYGSSCDSGQLKICNKNINLVDNNWQGDSP